MSRSTVVLLAFALLTISTAFAAPTPPAATPATAPTTAPIAPIATPLAPAPPTTVPTTVPATPAAPAPAVAPTTVPAAPAPSNSSAPAAPSNNTTPTVPSSPPTVAPVTVPATVPAAVPSAPGNSSTPAAPSNSTGPSAPIVPGAPIVPAPSNGTVPAAPSNHTAPSAPSPVPPPAPTFKTLQVRIVNSIYFNVVNGTTAGNCIYVGDYTNAAGQTSTVQFTAQRGVNSVLAPFTVPIYKINGTWTQLSIYGQCTGYDLDGDQITFNTQSYNATQYIADQGLNQQLTLFFTANTNYPQFPESSDDTAVNALPASNVVANATGVAEISFNGLLGTWGSNVSLVITPLNGNFSYTFNLSNNFGQYANITVPKTLNASVALMNNGNQMYNTSYIFAESQSYTIGIVAGNVSDGSVALQIIQDNNWNILPASASWTIVHAIPDGTTIQVTLDVNRYDGTNNTQAGTLTYAENVEQFSLYRGDQAQVTIVVTGPTGGNVTFTGASSVFSNLNAQLPQNSVYSARNVTLVFLGENFAAFANSSIDDQIKVIASDNDATEAAAQGVVFVRFTNFLYGANATDITYSIVTRVPPPPAAPATPVAPVAPVAPPAAPQAPAAPGVPAAPSNGTGPAAPSAPSAPVAPVAPAAPSNNTAPTVAPGAAPATAPTGTPAIAPAVVPAGVPVAPTAAPVAPAATPVAPIATPVAPAATPVAPIATPVAPIATPLAPAPVTKLGREMKIAIHLGDDQWLNTTVAPGDVANEVAVPLNNPVALYITDPSGKDVLQNDFQQSLSVGEVVAVYATGNTDSAQYGPKVTWTHEVVPTPPGPTPAPENKSIWKKPWPYVIIGGVALVLVGAIIFCVVKKRGQDENKPLLP